MMKALILLTLLFLPACDVIQRFYPLEKKADYRPIPDGIQIEFRLAKDASEPGFTKEHTNDSGKFYLSETPELGNRDIASLSLHHSNGEEVLMIKFTPEGALRLASITGAHLNELLAILINDQLMSAPIIKQEITGGEAQVTFGPGLNPDKEKIRKLLKEKF